MMLMLAFAWSATRLRKFSQDFPLYHPLHSADSLPPFAVDVLIIIIILIRFETVPVPVPVILTQT
jgi:hypothetical protein